MNRFVGPLLILLCTVIWGSSFVAQKLGADSFGPFAINCFRNLLAGIFLGTALAVRGRFARRVRSELGESRLGTTWKRSEILGGALSGVAVVAAELAQQIGIERTTPGVSAFLTANYVLIVPLFAWAVGKGRPGLGVWLGVALALAGTYFLSFSSPSPSSSPAGFVLGPGEAWTLVCAVLFAVQIMVVDHFADSSDMLRFSTVQMAVAGVIAFPFVFLPSELARLSASGLMKGLPALLYLGIFSSGIAYTLQNLGQARTPPALAAILMSMESVFGALFGWLLLGDLLSVRQIWGCIFVLSAVLLSQLFPQLALAFRRRFLI